MVMPYSIIGNTSDFGSEITGSNPVRVTNVKPLIKKIMAKFKVGDCVLGYHTQLNKTVKLKIIGISDIGYLTDNQGYIPINDEDKYTKV